MIEINFAQLSLVLGLLCGTLIGVSLDELVRSALAVWRERR